MGWKVKWDSYKETIEPYYFKYMNACIRFMAQGKPNAQNLLVDEQNDRLLADLVRSLKKHQGDSEYQDESYFLQSKNDHDEKGYEKSACCQNIVSKE